MSQANLATLITWLNPASKPLLIQLPQPAYERLINRWMLPKLTNASQR
jgi:hypothetical protein